MRIRIMKFVIKRPEIQESDVEERIEHDENMKNEQHNAQLGDVVDPDLVLMDYNSTPL